MGGPSTIGTIGSAVGVGLGGLWNVTTSVLGIGGEVLGAAADTAVEAYPAVRDATIEASNGLAHALDEDTQARRERFVDDARGGDLEWLDNRWDNTASDFCPKPEGEWEKKLAGANRSWHTQFDQQKNTCVLAVTPDPSAGDYGAGKPVVIPY